MENEGFRAFEVKFIYELTSGMSYMYLVHVCMYCINFADKLDKKHTIIWICKMLQSTRAIHASGDRLCLAPDTKRANSSICFKALLVALCICIKNLKAIFGSTVGCKQSGCILKFNSSL